MNKLIPVVCVLAAALNAFAFNTVKEACEAVNKLGYAKQVEEARALAFKEIEARTNVFDRIQLMERAAHFYRYSSKERKALYAKDDVPRLVALYRAALAVEKNEGRRLGFVLGCAERTLETGDTAKTLAFLDEAAKIAADSKDTTLVSRVLDFRGKMDYTAKRWDAAITNFVAAIDTKRSPKRIMGEAWEAILNVTRAGRHAEAQDWCRRIRALPGIDAVCLVKSYEIEARSYRAEGVKEKVPALVEEFLGAAAAPGQTVFSGANVVEFCKLMAPQLTDVGTLGFKTSYDFLERVLATPKKFGIEKEKDLFALIDVYRARAWRGMDRARTASAHAMAEKLGRPYPENEFSKELVRHWTEMASFPKDEKDLRIPNDLQDFGFDPDRKVVHAKDFGWNPTNATECLQKALDSDASTVVIDDMGSPWYIWQVKLSRETCSNRKILFKKGVTVLSAPEHNRKDEPGWYRLNMFQLAAPSNLVIMGEGDFRKKDVYVGKYRNRAERFAAGWEYGGSGFGGACRNTLIKNLFVANCGQDALCWGGKNSFVVDCVFDDNFRQGMSIGGGENCVYKNVTFSNTFGGEPHNGVDFEPYYEMYSCPHHYFLDCRFFNNAAGNLIFATSTYAPMTAYFKRCEFEANANQNITILARAGIYLEAKVKAPSKIVFEDCRMDGYADSTILKFCSSFLYDVTFRNCTMNEKGLFRRDGRPVESPITLNLDRKIYDGFYPNAGIVTFENVKINGYRGRELVKVLDRNGRYGINTFRGEIDFNGEKVDMSKFSYLPPDLSLSEIDEPALAALKKPVSGFSRAYHPPFRFDFRHAYYNPRMAADLVVWGEKGKTVSFRIRQKCRAKEDATFNVTMPSGTTAVVGRAAEGPNAFTYTFAETGAHRFDPNFPTKAFDDEILDEGFVVEEVKGAPTAFYPAATRLGHEVRFVTGEDFAKYVGYFEVPGGTNCWIKVMGGGLELVDAEGRVVERLEEGSYGGSKCLSFATKSGKSEIWSFRMLSGALTLKFFAPLPGLFADDPEWLPTVAGGELPFHRVKKEFASSEEIPSVVLFPLPVTGKLAEVVDWAAKQRADFGRGKDWVKKYAEARAHYDWKAPAAQTREELALAAAELEAIEPIRKMRDMQLVAARESADLRRYVAFVQLCAPVLVMEPDEIAAFKKAVEGFDPSAEDAEWDVEYFDDEEAAALNAKINRYGAEWLEDGLYYSDYSAVLKLAPQIWNVLKERP